MSLDFLSLKAKHQAKEFALNIYPTEFDKFSKFVEFLNRNKSQEEAISAEDVFAEIMKVTDQVEGFSEYLATRKGARRGRKSNSGE